MKYLSAISIFIIQFLIPNNAFSEAIEGVKISQPPGEHQVVQAKILPALTNRPPQISEADMEKITNQMRETQKQAVRVRLEVLAEPESIALIAKFTRSLFDSLLKQGFTEDQALEIVASIGLPSRR